jgi:uncharacterized damage-inducible protein DinB
MTPAHLTISAPEPAEYAPYYGRYTSLVSGSDILTALRQQTPETVRLLSAVNEQQADFRYAPDKWSIKELVGHVLDTERIFAYRALRIARNDKTPIEGYEQDDYVRYGRFGNYRLSDLIEEFGHVRTATMDLLRGLDQEAWLRRGTANKNEISVRAIAYVIAGHELHHRQILKEKYLPLLSR